MSNEVRDELLTVYAAMILHSDGAEITSERISKLTAATGAKVEAYWASLFAKLCKNQDLNEILSSCGGGGGGAAPAAAAAAGDAGAGDAGAAPAAAKVEEEEEEEGMDFDLFG
uniref:60S acidic ribosomal protein P1 n=1 Tax=Oxyrrhis marina TaxID=2969 RepID=A0A7S4GPE4_OXYMA|mmetsp:Transcript_11285/g.27026  ORF Transcript_11285/g.27026 Transcript_11285/m.27026 type:complete len:113 (-) Transcript_11285:48-386(-)